MAAPPPPPEANERGRPPGAGLRQQPVPEPHHERHQAGHTLLQRHLHAEAVEVRQRKVVAVVATDAAAGRAPPGHRTHRERGGQSQQLLLQREGHTGPPRADGAAARARVARDAACPSSPARSGTNPTAATSVTLTTTVACCHT